MCGIVDDIEKAASDAGKVVGGVLTGGVGGILGGAAEHVGGMVSGVVHGDLGEFSTGVISALDMATHGAISGLPSLANGIVHGSEGQIADGLAAALTGGVENNEGVFGGGVLDAYLGMADQLTHGAVSGIKGFLAGFEGAPVPGVPGHTGNAENSSAGHGPSGGQMVHAQVHPVGHGLAFGDLLSGHSPAHTAEHHALQTMVNELGAGHGSHIDPVVLAPHEQGHAIAAPVMDAIHHHTMEAHHLTDVHAVADMHHHH